MTQLFDRGMLSSRRARLVALLAVATAAIGVLVFVAASDAASYYATPEELADHIGEQTDVEGSRWRIGGRVVPDSIAEENGRPIAWDVEGEDGGTVAVVYDGIVPDLFAPRTFVVVEGIIENVGHADQRLVASSVIIKHESEFVTDPEDASIAE